MLYFWKKSELINTFSQALSAATKNLGVLQHKLSDGLKSFGQMARRQGGLSRKSQQIMMDIGESNLKETQKVSKSIESLAKSSRRWQIFNRALVGVSVGIELVSIGFQIYSLVALGKQEEEFENHMAEIKVSFSFYNRW